MWLPRAKLLTEAEQDWVVFMSKPLPPVAYIGDPLTAPSSSTPYGLMWDHKFVRCFPCMLAKLADVFPKTQADMDRSIQERQAKIHEILACNARRYDEQIKKDADARAAKVSSDTYWALRR